MVSLAVSSAVLLVEVSSDYHHWAQKALDYLVRRATCVVVSLVVMLLLVVEDASGSKRQTTEDRQVFNNRQAHLAYDLQLFEA